MECLFPAREAVRLGGAVDEMADSQKTFRNPGANPPLAGASAVPGMDFGNYELLEELGRGGMGIVYKARQKDLDRLVAVKVILAGRLATTEQVQRFHDEARAAAKVQHPGIVHIYEAGEVRGNHYFVMEYIAGCSLAEIASTASLDLETSVELISAVARTVEHLHAHAIVHRDLKPSNILLDKQRRPYVTDFGLAMMMERLGDPNQPAIVAGTPNYMAPEQAAGAVALIGPRTDVYCLGSVLYHLLTGRPPFKSDTAMEALVRVMENEPPRPSRFNPSIPAELETICLRCLEKRPQDRYASAGALADDLDRFLRGEVVEAQPPGLWHRLRSWSRRQPACAARVSGLAVCAVIAQVRYQLTPNTTLRVHLGVMSVLAAWFAGSVLCQWLLGRERCAERARWMWATMEVVLLTVLLRILNALISPLVVGYAVLIAVAGLWLRERLVWAVTAVSVLGYALLVADAWQRDLPFLTPHWHLVFVAVLAVLGAVVAHQVHRFRRLSRYYRR